MGTNQIYICVLLLASLSASCTSDCPNLGPYSEQPFRKCAKLYIMLETALLANPENQYKLQTCFFPSSSSEPIYVQVTFKLNKRFYHTCWTSSVLLKSVDPSALRFLQLELLNILLATEDPPAGFFTGFVNNEVDVSLNLTVNSTLSDYSPKIINAVLQELTSWLKVYASTRWSHSADIKYKGYNCVPYALPDATVPDMTVTNLLFSTVVLTVALTTIALFRVAPKLYRKVASRVERGNQWYSFFWAASFIASLCNMAVVSFEGVGLAIATVFFPQTVPQYSIKLTMICLLIPFDFLVATCIIPKSAEFPIPSLTYILSFPICCTCCCCTRCCCTCCRHSKQLRSKWIQALALTSLLLFTQLVALSALPTILWVVLFPTQTLANITLFTAAIFCTTALIALLIRNTGQLMCSGGCRRDNCYRSLLQLLPILMVALFLAIMAISSYLYVKLITSGVEPNQIGGFIVTFLPSAILTIIGWFVTKGKFIKQMFPQESNSTRSNSQVEPPNERTPLNASINV